MKAMVLAAGLGTRLRPLTNDRPKALVEVAGRTLLEITLLRLRGVGVNQVIVNVHHFADMVCDFLKSHQGFGMEVEVSREDILLDTGGGLKKAAHFFLRDAGPEPFFLHNVDVISTIDLRRMLQLHGENRALATLAVQDRKTSRYLLFNQKLELCGRQISDEKPEIVRPSDSLKALAFSGIHVISPRLLGMMQDDGAFSIIKTYLELASREEKILGFPADEFYWRDMGKPESILQVTEDLKNRVLQQ